MWLHFDVYISLQCNGNRSARQCLCTRMPLSLSLSLSLSIHCPDIKLQNIYRPDLALGLVIGWAE